LKIPFGPFEPDKSQFDPSASPDVVNALPVVSGWGPMPGLMTLSEALPAACLGACFVRTSTGTLKTIAATATGIYELNNTDYSWTDITGTSGPYNADERWSFTRFGDLLIIHQINDPIQVYDINSGGDVTDLGGTPPNAKYSWVAGDFLVLGNLTGTAGERTVRWSGYNDPEAWVLGEKGADFQELPEGGEIVAGFGDRGGFYVIQREGMQYFPFALETGYTFARTVLNPNQGSVSARSVVNIGSGQFFYLSEDGFFSGANRRPIGAERVDKWFMSQLDAAYIQDVQGSADPYEKMVWWSYKSQSGARKMLGYDWQLDRWCRSDLSIGDVIPLVTLGVTWDALDDLYDSIEDAAASFDSRLFLGGRPTLATFDDQNRLSFFAGVNLEAVFKTGYAQMDSLSRAFVNGCRVTTDANSLTVLDTVKDYHGATATDSATSSMNRAGLVPTRVDGRLHRFTVTVPEGADWSILSDIDVNAQPSGQQ
jgi:hypothetical protein